MLFKGRKRDKKEEEEEKAVGGSARDRVGLEWGDLTGLSQPATSKEANQNDNNINSNNEYFIPHSNGTQRSLGSGPGQPSLHRELWLPRRAFVPRPKA